MVIFVHSGSLAIGAAVFNQLDDPAAVLEVGQEKASAYLEAMNNAANFAFANRLSLGLMATKALSEVLGRSLSSRLVYDAPHNFIEQTYSGDFRHRKGATPAQGPEGSHDSHTFPSGHPVLIPGSMGTESWVLAGSGSPLALESTAHGAGRALSRTKAAAATPNLDGLTIVTPIDEQKMKALGRSDILAEQQRSLREEAPGAYKDLESVISSTTEAGAARQIARLKPLLTIKG